MAKKYELCALILLLAVQGTALSMMHAKKIIKNTSRLQQQKRVYSEGGLTDDVKIAVFLKNVIVSDDLTKDKDGDLLRRAYIDCIYKLAQIEAMCKIESCPNLDPGAKVYLHNQVRQIVRK